MTILNRIVRVGLLEEVVLDPRLAGGRIRPDKALLAGHWRESAFPLRWNERLLTYILKGSF